MSYIPVHANVEAYIANKLYHIMTGYFRSQETPPCPQMPLGCLVPPEYEDQIDLNPEDGPSLSPVTPKVNVEEAPWIEKVDYSMELDVQYDGDVDCFKSMNQMPEIDPEAALHASQVELDKDSQHEDAYDFQYMHHTAEIDVEAAAHIGQAERIKGTMRRNDRLRSDSEEDSPVLELRSYGSRSNSPQTANIGVRRQIDQVKVNKGVMREDDLEGLLLAHGLQSTSLQTFILEATPQSYHAEGGEDDNNRRAIPLPVKSRQMTHPPAPSAIAAQSRESSRDARSEKIIFEELRTKAMSLKTKILQKWNSKTNRKRMLQSSNTGHIKCTVKGCNYRSENIHHMMRHIHTHYPDAYFCPVCDELFSRVDALDRHFRLPQCQGLKSKHAVGAQHFEVERDKQRFNVYFMGAMEDYAMPDEHFRCIAGRSRDPGLL